MLPSQVTSLSCFPPSAHHLTLINSLAVGLFASIISVCEAECFFFFFFYQLVVMTSSLKTFGARSCPFISKRKLFSLNREAVIIS